MAAPKKRSPLKEKPLRQAGQSLEEQIQDNWDDVTSWFLFIVGFVALFIYEWIRWFNDGPPNPWLATAVFLLVAAFSSYKVYRKLKEIRRLKMARDGERIVGEQLDELKAKKAGVLHDIVGRNFNVDHVVIARRGIFVIDTKTYSKPSRGHARIRVENSKVFADGYAIERDPIAQVKANAAWVRDLLKESTGKLFPVRPVVLFPGWFVEPMKGGEEVWVLNPKALETFISNEEVKISKDDQHLITFHLSQYVRSKV